MLRPEGCSYRPRYAEACMLRTRVFCDAADRTQVVGSCCAKFWAWNHDLA